MKLFTTRMAPNPRRVSWFLAEKGVTDIETVQVDLISGGHRTPEYLAEVGQPISPALILDDGAALTESLAICRYLESLYPEPSLFGRTPREQAFIEMWTRRAELNASMPLMLAVRHSYPPLAALETQVPEVAAAQRALAERGLRSFDVQLGKTPWVAGESISIADGVLFSGLEFARIIKFRPPEDMINLLRWQEAMRARPSAAAGG